MSIPSEQVRNLIIQSKIRSNANLSLFFVLSK